MQVYVLNFTWYVYEHVVYWIIVFSTKSIHGLAYK